MKTSISKIPGKHIAMTIIFLVSIVAFKGCKDDDEETVTSGPAANEVWMQNSKFSPASRTVSVNTTVKWINKDGFDHNVVSDSALFDSGIIAAGTSFSRTFSTAGTYPYTCTLHSNMTGVIIVQ